MEEYIKLLQSIFNVPEEVIELIQPRFHEIEDSSHFYGMLKEKNQYGVDLWNGKVLFIRDIPQTKTAPFGNYIVSNIYKQVMTKTVKETEILFKII